MEAKAPIGVFDSGVGGLATLKVLRQVMPHETFLYYGDNANAPYGVQTVERIQALTLNCVDFLLDKGVKCVVIACNTASSAAVEAVRAHTAVPIVAMEPAVRPAVELVGEGEVLVMATQATLCQTLFQERIEECGLQERMIAVPCPTLVELVEGGQVEGEAVHRAVEGYLAPYQERNVQVIVVGCTHFVHLENVIQTIAQSLWPEVRIIDGNLGTAQQLQRILQQQGGETPEETEGSVAYYTSGEEATYLPLFERLMNG